MDWLLRQRARDPGCKLCLTATGLGGEILSPLGTPMIPSAPSGTGSWYERTGLFARDGYTASDGVFTPGSSGGEITTKLDMRGWQNGFTILGEWDFTDAPDSLVTLATQGDYNGSTTRLFTFGYTTGHRFAAAVYDDEGTAIVVQAGGANTGLTLTGKHRVAFRLSGTSLTIHVDTGTVFYTATNASFSGTLGEQASATAAHNALWLGRKASSAAFPFTTVMVFNRALDNDEIGTLFELLETPDAAAEPTPDPEPEPTPEPEELSATTDEFFVQSYIDALSDGDTVVITPEAHSGGNRMFSLSLGAKTVYLDLSAYTGGVSISCTGFTSQGNGVWAVTGTIYPWIQSESATAITIAED